MPTIHDPPDLASESAPRQAAGTVPGRYPAPAARRPLRAAKPGESPVKRPRETATDHTVNVSDQGFSYSTGNPDCCEKCGGLPRGLYQGMRFTGTIPVVHARVRTGTGRKVDMHYLMSATADSSRHVIPEDEIKTGDWAKKIGVARSFDRRIGDAMSTAIVQIAYGNAVPEIDGAPKPDARTSDGRIVPPIPEALPAGYFQPREHLPQELVGRGLVVLASIARRRPNIALSVGASAMAHMTAGTYDSQGHWWCLIGDTSVGKSSLLMACAAVWGDPRVTSPDGIVMSWSVTPNGAPRRLGLLAMYPAFYDESGTAGFAADKWAELIYATSQGNTKSRAARVGHGDDNTPGWCSVLFTTGNANVTEGVESGRFAGLPARVVTLYPPFTAAPVGPPKRQDEAKRLKRAAYDASGIIGPAIVRDYRVADLRIMIDRATGELGIAGGSVAGRVAEYLGQAIAGAEAMGHVIGGPVLAAQLRASAMTAARTYIAEKWTEPEKDGARMQSAIVGTFAANIRLFPTAADYRDSYSKPSGAMGAQDADYIYLFTETWRTLAKREGTDSKRALEEMFRAGVLMVPESRAARKEYSTAAPRWAHMAMCYRISRAALFGPDGGQAADAAPAPPPPAPEPPAMLDIPEPPPADLATLGRVRQVADMSPQESRRAIFLGQANARAAKRRRALSEPQRTALGAALAALDGGADAPRLRVLAAMEGGREGPGPFAPMRGKRGPYFKPPMPPVVQEARPVAGWSFDRAYGGPVVTLDRNASYPAAMSSVNVAHGELSHNGDMTGESPGFYLVPVYKWTETAMPSPLTGKPGEKAWIPHPLMDLLRELESQGRWPDSTPEESWTGDPARLDSWAHFIAEIRRYALENYGPGSDQYAAVKSAYGQARALMLGSWQQAEHGPLLVKQWKCKTHRPDWAAAIEAQSAVTVWRDADKINRAVRAESQIVAIRSIDAMVIPESAMAITQGDSPIIRIDQSGMGYGTYKVQGVSTND
jgi:hypothetical protein